MSRTTLNIDTPVLEELKRLQKEENKPLGKLASELLADALSRRSQVKKAPSFKWLTRRMSPLVDIGDKEAVYAILDRDQH